MNFEIFNFKPSIMANIKDLGYSVPTPIQHEAIPLIMQGKDVIGLAQTGTGKTAAFVLPILEHLQSRQNKGTRALIVSPTRELAEQTCKAVNQLGKRTGLTCITVYGGENIEEQSRRLHGNPQIVVGCPGRLLDHLWRGTMNLSSLEILVIDEADRMFDMGFLPDIRHILACIIQKRQTLLFSATMPEAIKRLACNILHQPVTVQVERQQPAQTVSHTLYPVQQHLKTSLLKEMINQIKTDSVLVFTRTKHRAERLAQQLIKEGHKVKTLQGNLSQNQRHAALRGFRNGSIKILVATDIAARGIDVSSISHVINYDMPDTVEDYIHRIGRTGRINKKGEALTLVTSADKGKVSDLEVVLKAPLKRLTLKGFNYNATQNYQKDFKRQNNQPPRAQNAIA